MAVGELRRWRQVLAKVPAMGGEIPWPHLGCGGRDAHEQRGGQGQGG
jgi:hypothetical protein